jgi:hypothetical protein
MELRAFDLGKTLEGYMYRKQARYFLSIVVGAEAVITVCVVGSVSGYYGSCIWQCYSGNYDFLYLVFLWRMRN